MVLFEWMGTEYSFWINSNSLFAIKENITDRLLLICINDKLEYNDFYIKMYGSNLKIFRKERKSDCEEVLDKSFVFDDIDLSEFL